MKEVYLIRHAEKDSSGVLTEEGKKRAIEMRDILPSVAKVIASDSPRTIVTAELVSGTKPLVDSRAGFYLASPEKSDALNAIAQEQNISFLEAVKLSNDDEVIAGVRAKAAELNSLIDEILNELADDKKALIVSHDLSISPAMKERGLPLASLDYLCGYVISSDDAAKYYSPKAGHQVNRSDIVFTNELLNS